MLVHFLSLLNAQAKPGLPSPHKTKLLAGGGRSSIRKPPLAGLPFRVWFMRAFCVPDDPSEQSGQTGSFPLFILRRVAGRNEAIDPKKSGLALQTRAQHAAPLQVFRFSLSCGGCQAGKWRCEILGGMIIPCADGVLTLWDDNVIW